MTRPADLPDFGNPPITEVALGVQFEDIVNFDQNIGAIWDAFRPNFPTLRTQPSIPPMFEVFGPSAGSDRMQMVLTPASETPRLWLIDRNESQLIQLQSDRMLHNWRKVTIDDTYPHYESIKPLFLDEYNVLNDLVSRLTGKKLALNQCEITYFNKIVLGRDMSRHPAKVFRAVGDAVGVAVPGASSI